MISMIQAEVVTHYHWMTMGEFTDIVAVSQSTPGPIGINSATYVGYTAITDAGYAWYWGLMGSLTATVAVVLPSFMLMLIISKFLMKYKNHPTVEHVFRGLRPAVVGLLAAASLLLMTEENFGHYSECPWQFWISCALFVATFVGTYYVKINPIRMIAYSAVAGLVLLY